MPKKTHPVRSRALPVHIALWADGPHGPISQANRSLTHVKPIRRAVHFFASMPDPYRHGPETDTVPSVTRPAQRSLHLNSLHQYHLAVTGPAYQARPRTEWGKDAPPRASLAPSTPASTHLPSLQPPLTSRTLTFAFGLATTQVLIVVPTHSFFSSWALGSCALSAALAQLLVKDTSRRLSRDAHGLTGPP